MSLAKKIMVTALLLLMVNVGLAKSSKTKAKNKKYAEECVISLKQMSDGFAAVVEKTSPAIVSVQVEKIYPDENKQKHSPFFDDDFFDKLLSPNRKQTQKPANRLMQASGFLITNDGYIITNNHVVSQTSSITIKLGDSSEFKAKIIGTDRISDIAVLKIEAENTPYIEWANSDELKVGQWVLAIGNPFGLSHTVTAGIVSAKGRNNVGITDYEDFIQTDAAINPGNSGGPLINLNGKAIGVNTAIVSRTGGNMGIGLAVPADIAKAIYLKLMEKGRVVRGSLDIYVQQLTPKWAKSLGLKNAKGVVITGIIQGSTAEKAGLKIGDVVVEFDGAIIDGTEVFRNRAAMLTPGEKTNIVVIRNKDKVTLVVEIDKNVLANLGFTVSEITKKMAKKIRLKSTKGVMISGVEPESIAQKTGLKAGLVIVEVNKRPVGNVKEFYEIINQVKNDKYLLLLVKNRSSARYVSILAD